MRENKRSGPGFPSLVAAVALLFAVGLLEPGNCMAHNAKAAVQPDQVLLLHSYHHGFAWTDNITTGVERVLEAAGRPIELTVEYMDAKRKNDEVHYANLAALYRGKFPPGSSSSSS